MVYDVAVADADAFGHVLDRVSYLNNLYRADPFRSSIVVVLHGDEILLFAVKNLDDNEALIRRAQSLTVAGPIEFRICTQAARGHGLEPNDLHGFVTMVPMADAEIVKLQREENHAYMQAFKEHAGDPLVWAHRGALDYVGEPDAGPSDSAQRRLAQRREALFPWVDESTYLVPPDVVFEEAVWLEVGGVELEVRHMGPAHAPGDSIMIVKDHGAVFSGDVIYGGRIPFLDSPETDIDNWLGGLDYIAGLKGKITSIIPGHGAMSHDPQQAVDATRDYITDVRTAMAQAVADFTPFDQAYEETDWSKYEDLPAFDASNRGNAYRIYLVGWARSLQ